MNSAVPINDTLNVNQILDNLILELGFGNEEESQKEALRQNWLIELNREIMEAVYASLEDRVIRYITQKYPKEEELFWFSQMIESSPQTKVAILEAVENFKKNILQEYKALIAT